MGTKSGRIASCFSGVATAQKSSRLDTFPCSTMVPMVPLDFQSFFAAKNHQAVLLPEKLALTGLLAVPLLDGSTFGSWAALALDQWEGPRIEDSL